MKFFGDKSISHRALILSSLCNGTSIIKNISKAVDVNSTMDCLELCGIQIIREKNIKLIGSKLQNPLQILNCGNSGTTARLLIGFLAGQKISATFIGDSSLSSRPMSRISVPIGLMGSEISTNKGLLPISIKTQFLCGIDYTPKIASAQIKSSILLAGLGAGGVTKLSEKYLTRNHTEIMMKNMGIDINIIDSQIKLKQIKHKLNPMDIYIPGDPSTASFFAAAALLINKEIILEKILLNETRTGFFKIIEQMGAKIEYINVVTSFGEKMGDIRVTPNQLHSIIIDKKIIPSIIDEIPIIAILASQANGQTKLTGGIELRYKESDRISAICSNLNNMGVKIDELNDGFIIHGKSELNGTKIKTYKDHRIAMAFSIAGLITNGKTHLDDEKCIEFSCPEFFILLKELIN